jgi:pSer/pThr/pTyr-binding forkhead associated (FHA) protein
VIRLTAVIEVEGQAPRAITHESNARSIVIGRDPSADLQLPLSTVSRQHARISEADEVYVIEDLGSTHGTLVNGRAVPKGEKKVLRDGDIVEVTKAKITCNIEKAKLASAEPGEGTAAVAVRAVQGILGRLGEAREDGAFFRVISGAGDGERFSLGGTGTEWSFGRSKDCEFWLDDPNVSRRHALVKKDWNGFTISDLGSRNGVFVNEHKLSKPRRLKDRDEVVIGPIKLVFVDPDADLLAALKDVPGFEVDEHAEESVAEPSVLGAPKEDLDAYASGLESAEAPPALPTHIERRAEPSDESALEDLDTIDPELLAGNKPKFPVEWVVIASVGALVVACVVLLVVILT